MLPNKMKISEQAFNALRKFQGNTGVTVNVGARLAFFISIEREFRYGDEEIELKHRELDKFTWLGEHADIVEMLLKERYPAYDNSKIYKAWGAHIDDGSIQIEQVTSLSALGQIFSRTIGSGTSFN